MRNIFKSRAFILLVFTFFCLLLIVMTSNNIGDFEWLGESISGPFRPVIALFDSVFSKVSANFQTFGNAEVMLEENESLKERIKELEKENRELFSYKDKIEELQSALNLKGRFSEYTLIGGNVITRDVGNWFNIFKIDIGTTSGVRSDLAVVSSNMGLVGRTVSATANSSNVITLIDEECVVSGWIKGLNSGAVVVRGDLTLKEQGYCRIDLIPEDMEVKPGDIVETSGIGGIFPRGIEIGTILSVKQTGNGLVRYAVVEPFANIVNVEEVFVLMGYGRELEAGTVERDSGG